MECKRCGAPLQQGVLICPECGARQRRSPDSVRCASCHGRVPVGLTVCPHCGRTFRPAGPRWGLWALLFAGIVLVALWGLGRLPVERVRRQIGDTRDQLSGLVQVLDVPTSLPATPTVARVAAARTATPVASSSISPTQTLTTTLAGVESPEQQLSGAITATWTVTPTSAISATGVVAPKVSGTPAATTAASTLTPTSAATASPARTETSTPARKVNPTPTSAATKASGVTYTVKSGDTLAGIGAQYGIAWQDIAAANNISAATGLQIGQILRIPVAGAPPAPTAVPRPQATVTLSPVTATPAPTLSAPVLDGPADGSGNEGEKAQIELRWQPVTGMPAGALYQVTVEYMEGGQKRTESLPATASTGTRFPPWLYGRADLPGRQYTWYVTVVRMATDGKGGELAVPLSSPSDSWSFGWQ